MPEQQHHFTVGCECEMCTDIEMEPYPSLDKTMLRERAENRCQCKQCVTDRPWFKFRRTGHTEFWAVIDPEGYWVDSAATIDLAMEWAMRDAGDHNKSPYKWFTTVGKELGYEIISHHLTKKLFFAGLLK